MSGIKVLSTINFTRRNRFILASSLTFGLGNLLVPSWATYLVRFTLFLDGALPGDVR